MNDFQKPKVVMAMHDMCGYGRSSLTAVYPVLSALNVQICPLPTALLSHHFGFSFPPSFLNLGETLEQFIVHWKEEQFHFDAFYSGYLADPTQVNLAKKFIREFQPTYIYVDPVLGDNGKLYKGYDDTQVDAIRELIKEAQMISPNITEASFLLKREVPKTLEWKEAKDMLYSLANMGPRYVCITGVHDFSGQEISVWALEKETGQIFKATMGVFEGLFHGTGDAFASVILGYLMKGVPFNDCVNRAMTYLWHCLKLAVEYKSEICLEPPLPLLMAGEQMAHITYF